MSHPINSYSQIRIILILGLLYVCWVVTEPERNSLGGTSTPARVEKAVVKISSEINRNLPFMVNSETRVETTRPGLGKSIVIEYTLVKLSKKDQGDQTKNFERMKTESIHKYRTEKRMNAIREMGLVVHHRFYDREGNLLTEYQVGPENLR